MIDVIYGNVFMHQYNAYRVSAGLGHNTWLRVEWKCQQSAIRVESKYLQEGACHYALHRCSMRHAGAATDTEPTAGRLELLCGQRLAVSGCGCLWHVLLHPGHVCST